MAIISQNDSFLASMYVLEIKQKPNWLAAICPDKNQAIEYLETLSTEIQSFASCYEISVEDFPLIVIENCGEQHIADSYFEFYTIAQLQVRLNSLRKQKQEDEEYIYFKYYFFDEAYFQAISDSNYMRYLRHTCVTNAVLDEPYEMSVFHEKIKKCASNYDIERLDELFEKTKTIFTSEIEKQDLAKNGYESLFWDMNYDHACSKLTEAGISYLLPMVENMELLLDKKMWQHRSLALHILLETACQNQPERAFDLLKQTVNAFNNYLIANPEEKLEIHRLLSQAHRLVMEIDAKNVLEHWQNAFSEMKKATIFSPENASWSSLFELLYTPFGENEKLQKAQEEAKIAIHQEIEALEKTFGLAITYPIALAYKQLGEYLDWKEINDVFPESEALCWAEKALDFNLAETTRIDLHECAEFFHRIGSNYKRIDFLAKTISLYDRVLNAASDCAFEVYYTANLWKEIAEIHLQNQAFDLADEAINEANTVYNTYNAQIKSNRSTYLHYAEFLEYCFTYIGKIEKPSLAELKTVAEEVEIESEGFLSYPYELLMRIALFEKNEKQAILEITKSMILHESCAISTIDSLLEEIKNSNFNQLKAFLNETKLFVEEVSENYYYNPEVKWKQVRTMSADELTAYWEKRKEEIKNRPPFAIE